MAGIETAKSHPKAVTSQCRNVMVTAYGREEFSRRLTGALEDVLIKP
jgi:hypothetical protein